MRKKKQPKSSTDVTESESDDSGDEMATTSRHDLGDESDTEVMLHNIEDVAANAEVGDGDSDSDVVATNKRRKVSLRQKTKPKRTNEDEFDLDNEDSSDDR